MTNDVEQVKTRSRAASRTTKQSRQAIAMFVEQNLPRLDCWMQQVANGIPKVNADCEPLRDMDGSIIYVIKPDPATAIKLVADICEYHLPKLSRSEQSSVVRVEQGELDVTSMSTEDLKRYVLRQAGVDSLDVLTLNAEPLPEWLEQPK